jgi:hypothetical protein
MASTRQVVEWIKLNANGWNITGVKGILPILTEFQNMVLQTPTEQTIVLGSDGLLPAFDTQDGVYTYTFDDIWRITKVLVLDSDYRDFYYEYVSNNYPLNRDSDSFRQVEKYNGNDYVNIAEVSSVDSKSGNPAQITFSQNPGATTNTFRTRGYSLPNQIKSVNVPLTIPDRFHLSHVVPGVTMLIKAFENGTWLEAVDYIMQKIAPDIIASQNDGAQGNYTGTTRRGF